MPPAFSLQANAEIRRRSLAVAPCDVLKRHTANLGQHLGGLDHNSRHIALAAKFSRREIRRVGLDQNTVGWQLGGDGAQLDGILKRQDAGERNK
jgi:hypothetical protein